MRGKLATKIRREMRKRIEKEAENFKKFLNEAPLKKRIGFAFKILLRRI